MHRVSLAALAAASLAVPAQAADQPRPNIEEIVVTATPLTNDPDKLATIVGHVDRDEILRTGGANIADALANVPGVTGSGFAAGASRPVIRGFDSNRVRVMEDGIGSLDVSEVGPDHGVPIDPLAAQSIEVVRGAATLRYGSQAIGGVVNTINNRVPLALPDKTISGEANASYDTNADAVQGGAMVDARAGNLGLHLDAFGRHTSNYDIPGGTQPNSFFRGDGFSGGGSYFFGDGNRIGAAITRYDSKYGIPSDTTFIDMHQTKGLVRSSFNVDAGAFKTLTVDGGYADYKHVEIDPATNDVLATFLNKEWDTRTEALFGQIGPLAQTAVGVQLQHRNFSAEGDARGYLLPSSNMNAAAFLFTDMPLSQALRFQASGRVEHTSIKGTPVSGVRVTRDLTPLSGSAGVVFTASEGLNLGLTFASAARAPNLTELFARGPHDGPATYETGDASLKLERSNSLEATLHATLSPVHLEGSLWGAKFNNYIYGRLTGSTCDEDGDCSVGGEFRELFYEQHSAKFWGAEMKATVTLSQSNSGKLSADLLADYVRATLVGLGPVPRIPPYHIGGGLSWASETLDVGFMYKHAGSQTRIAAAETPTAGFDNIDAHVMLRPFRGQPQVEVGIVGRNLTDAVQRNAVSLNKDAVVMQGRDVRFILRSVF